MTGPSHIVGAALAGLGACAAVGTDTVGSAALVTGALVASRLPDIDAKVKPGKDHRSLPHSLLLAGGGVWVAALLLYVWLSSAAGTEAVASLGLPEAISAGVLALGVVGFAVGYLSHLVLDASTMSGIWLLFPGGVKVRLPIRWAVRTGGVKELLVAAVMMVLCALLVDPVFGVSVFEVLS